MRDKGKEVPDRSDLYPERTKAYKGKKTGLIKEYKSFDHLWNDIETQIRVVIAELQKPLIDDTLKNVMKCKKIKKVHAGTKEELDELRALVLQQEGKMDIFDQ